MSNITNHEELEGREEPEGMGSPEDSSWGDYPIDTFLIRNEPRTVHDVLRRIEQDRFVMDPDFQRDFIWDDQKQSRLIESVLLRIPLPVFYLAEDDKGRMIVVDGLQRLSTFSRFACNELKLQLKDRPELDGKRFADLSPKLQNRIEDCTLILYIIDVKVPERARLDIFERVNGGVPLTRQQMRNCLYVGEATRFLKKEVQTDLFRKATGGSLRPTTMRDREFVNRFCAFQLLDLDDYRDMDEFLAKCLKEMNRNPDCLSKLTTQFRNALENNYKLFGRHAFRKHQSGDGSRTVLNASLWDVMSTGLSKNDPRFVADRAEIVRKAFYDLMENEEFQDSITRGPNSLKQVKARFSITRDILGKALNA